VIERSLRMLSSIQTELVHLRRSAALRKKATALPQSTCSSERDKSVKSLAAGALVALSAQGRPIW
jgi:hypothetical protein